MKEILKEISDRFFASLGHAITVFIAIINWAGILLFDAVLNSLHGTRPEDEHIRIALAVAAGAGLLFVRARYLGH
jgi:F0F1-type ATP synthase membrane subunit a